MLVEKAWQMEQLEDYLASCLVTEQEIENTGLTPKWIYH